MPPVENFLDTNILIYALSDGPKAEIAQVLMAEPFVVSVQALNEFASVARRKLGLSWDRIDGAIEDISTVARSVVTLDPETTGAAIKLAARHDFSFYDALMVAAAVKAGCRSFYSEDLHAGLLVGDSLRVVNPFRATINP